MLSIIILAAGRGKRMHSARPKVMHQIGDKPLLAHVLKAAQALSPEAIYVVVGNGQEQIRQYFHSTKVQWIEQKEQLGTGHAVLQVLPHLNPEHQVLILYGDVPLISPASLKQLTLDPADFNLLVAKVANPKGLGRIIRNAKAAITSIVEERDASADQRQIHEIYSGIMLTKAALLAQWLPKLKAHNEQQEYYLPDVINLALQAKQSVKSIEVAEEEISGINDKVQLAQAERIFQLAQARELMSQGLQLIDPSRFDLRGSLKIGADVCIDVNTILEGEVVLGAGSSIGPNCYLRQVSIGRNVVIKANSIIEEAEIGDYCKVGPFARIRPGSVLLTGAQVGNFVEIKKSQLGFGSKVSHLSYIGDTTIGQKVNVGAGTVTCNYDGANKHQTIIGDGAFIGSNTSLVAPVTIGSNATIGAGSTITKLAPADRLTLARSKQTSLDNWERPTKPTEEADSNSKISDKGE